MALVNVLAAPAAPAGGRLVAAVVGVFALTATLLPGRGLGARGA